MGMFDYIDPNIAGSFDADPCQVGAYFGYMDKCTRLDGIVNQICAGETSLTVDDDITESDLEYVKNEVEKRMGGSCTLW